MAKITARNRIFIEEYVQHFNGMKAYMAAYPDASEATARVNASKLLARTEIQDAMSEASNETLKRNRISADRVLNEIANIAFLDPREMFTKDGELKGIHELPASVAACIAGLDISTGEQTSNKKIKFWNKMDGLQMLSRHLKICVNRQEHTGADGGPLEFQGKTEEDLDRAIEDLLRKSGKELVPAADL